MVRGSEGLLEEFEGWGRPEGGRFGCVDRLGGRSGVGKGWQYSWGTRECRVCDSPGRPSQLDGASDDLPAHSLSKPPLVGEHL